MHTSLPLSAKVRLAGGCAGGAAQVARRLEPTPYHERSDTNLGPHSGSSAQTITLILSPTLTFLSGHTKYLSELTKSTKIEIVPSTS